MKKWLVYIGLVVIFLGGCSPAARYKIARVVFDGVPPPTSGKGEGKTESSPGESPEQPGSSSKPSSPIFYSHYPYAEGSCDNCHDPQASNGLIEEGNKLCLTCHDDILTGAKVVHLPAEEDCLICHEPHRSKNAKLLKQPVEELCLTCHDKDDIEELHGEIMTCTNCHNPHQSNEEKLLKSE